MPLTESDDDFPALEVIASRQPSRLLVICDHASARIPLRYKDLGLSPDERYSHIAWDIGAAEVARRVSRGLDAALVLAGVSRLLVDCNRAEDEPGWMPANSCGIDVPGNRGLESSEIAYRKREWYDPYHQAVAARLDLIKGRGQVPAVIAVHSFTPSMAGQERPWHVGVLWNRDDRLARPVMDRLRQQASFGEAGIGKAGLEVGDNQPYSAREINHTLDTHAGKPGYPHISFEIRQDLLACEEGWARWADILIRALSPSLADESLYHPEFSLDHA